MEDALPSCKRQHSIFVIIWYPDNFYSNSFILVHAMVKPTVSPMGKPNTNKELREVNIPFLGCLHSSNLSSSMKQPSLYVPIDYTNQ
ncbi:hypothetical protein CR513_45277, partial [Mucuna pruriens]